MQAHPLSLPAVPEPTYGERLKHKVVIVTGAAQGIGEAIVGCFQAQQARLVIADIQAEKGRASRRPLARTRRRDLRPTRRHYLQGAMAGVGQCGC